MNRTEKIVLENEIFELNSRVAELESMLETVKLDQEMIRESLPERIIEVLRNNITISIDEI